MLLLLRCGCFSALCRSRALLLVSLYAVVRLSVSSWYSLAWLRSRGSDYLLRSVLRSLELFPCVFVPGAALRSLLLGNFYYARRDIVGDPGGGVLTW